MQAQVSRARFSRYCLSSRSRGSAEARAGEGRQARDADARTAMTFFTALGRSQDSQTQMRRKRSRPAGRPLDPNEEVPFIVRRNEVPFRPEDRMGLRDLVEEHRVRAGLVG